MTRVEVVWPALLGEKSSLRSGWSMSSPHSGPRLAQFRDVHSGSSSHQRCKTSGRLARETRGCPPASLNPLSLMTQIERGSPGTDTRRFPMQSSHSTDGPCPASPRLSFTNLYSSCTAGPRPGASLPAPGRDRGSEPKSPPHVDHPQASDSVTAVGVFGVGVFGVPSLPEAALRELSKSPRLPELTCPGCASIHTGATSAQRG
mmetsp:Transcript_82245/g.251328  ORF Transcript_82245/g.251328 Transcript_82245/m.251328 type:complete len:203 (+) Transcript_82245:109-717(+)